MHYKPRITDNEIEKKLNASGAVLIRGPKACGKTESAKRFAKSVLKVDRDIQVKLLMDTAPARLLQGETPRLIDEWQEQPDLWNYIRHEVDNRGKTGQFILTGSANPEEAVKMHSGAGRFAVIDMRTMSWQELGISSGKISLAELLKSKSIQIDDEPTDLEFIVERIVIGGFPTLLNKNIEQAQVLNNAYIELLAEVDMSRVSDVRRDPVKVRALLRSLARNTSTLADITTLQRDIKEVDNELVSRPTVYDYLDTLERMMLIEYQPAWNPHIRSSASLRKSPKHHFADTSLAVAVLNLNKEALLNDLGFCGFLFESQVVHDLRIYAQANNAEVSHYRDSSGLEVDAIIKQNNGDWAAFEIKLGTGQIETAAQSLMRFSDNINYEKMKRPKSLNIITGTGISYTRNDGINVIALGSLGA